MSTYHDLEEEVKQTIDKALPARLKVHSMTTRVKTAPSFLEKIDRKDYDDPFDEMTDIVGARIVCLFLDDITIVDEILKEKFDVHAKEDKTEISPPELFRYRSVHYECRIKDAYNGPRYDNIKGITFEVQVRTILQDAWAVIEHHLAYKGRASIPIDLQRDFGALVGLFHVADKQFQQLRASIDDSEERAYRTVKEVSGSDGFAASTDVLIDRGTLKAFLAEIFAGREGSDNETYSLLADELASVENRTIGELNSFVADNMEKMLELEAEEEIFDFNENLVERYTDVGFIRVMLAENIPEYELPEASEDDMHLK
ncbi:GTP pyrophosphokinase [Nocardia salmonicida]|uniref:GTP pyrophosphokinase n=1 Tax=Nocardia salmonicida TaxID=53431 RepID=UPI003654BAA5